MRIAQRNFRLLGLICFSWTLACVGQTSSTPSTGSPAAAPTPPLPPARPLPTTLAGTNTANPRPPGLAPVARFGGSQAVAQTSLPPAPLLKPLPLVWDSETKEYEAKPGDTNAVFAFRLTNNSPDVVVVTQVHTSCGCTVARLPATPWTLAPGTNGEIGVTVDLRGKRGMLVKTVTVYSTAFGPKALTVKVSVPDTLAASSTPGGSTDNRSRNMQIATADRQAVFRSDCGNCHAATTVGKKGAELYAAACGICHEAEHRATMVPDLKALNHSTDRIYWKVWASQGKVGSLMPGFSKSIGGPLDDDQIESLADFLVEHFPTRTAATSTVGAK